MEISITWNICRICLQEEQKSGKGTPGAQMRQIFSEGNKLADQIYECSGILMKPNDSLPEKICRKCIAILKYAIHFRKSCRDSDVYLHSVIQRTKSASSLFKQDKSGDALVDPISEDINIHYMDDDDDDLMSLSELSNIPEEQPKQEEHKRSNKRKQNHRILREYKKQKPADGPSTSSCSKENFTPAEHEYEEEHGNITDDIIAHEHEEEDVAEIDDEVIEKLEEETNQSHSSTEHSSISEKATTLDLEHDQECDEEQLSKDLKTNLHNPHAHFTKLGSQHLITKVVDCDESDDANGNEEESYETTELITLKSEHNALYYIINKDHPTIEEQQNDIEENAGSDDNVDFVPLGEEEELHHHMEHEDSEDVDNQTQVTSTVVTKEEIDIEDANSNLSRNTQEIDAEYIVDEYVIDDCGPHNTLLHPNVCTIEKNQSQAATKFSLNDIQPQIRRAVPASVGRRTKAPLHTHVASSTTNSSQQQVIVCDICGNHFTNRQLMNAHMKIHRQEKSHECELCFKRFITACNLQAHMRIHTGEKPFQCKFCGRRFTDRSTHLRHERIHTNEKPFSCEHCGKSFALATTLQAHLKVHTGERPYRCEPCAKSFKLPHQLKAHQNTHLHKAVEQSGSLE